MDLILDWLVVNILVYDFEVFKYDWILCWLDTKTKETYSMHNDKAKLEKFYEYYKDQIWIGYNSRNYDQWICKAILADFNPWDMNIWIIEKERKGYEFSSLLNKFPILNYDCSVGFRSLKELEAFMGHDIQETPIKWDIDRPLTEIEIKTTKKYCKHDVEETAMVFLETISEFESHIGLIKEFGLPISNISKTKAQISAVILGAVKKKRNDEFEITMPSTLDLGRYSWIRDWYFDWARNKKDYAEMSLETKVFDVPHTFGIGGLHGSRNNYFGDGVFLMADVASYYPALMIEYGFLSRNVLHPQKYKQIRDERLVMKANKDPRQAPRKIVLNGTFGASKDKYNNLYDPLMANNICIAGQVLLLDLLEKLEKQGKCELIQTNTDGILIKLPQNDVIDLTNDAIDDIMTVCNEWSKRTRMDLEFEEISKVIQRDVNNYIIVKKNGKVKRKGAVVKQLSKLDNDLPIVNKAVVDYFVKNIPVEETVMNCKELIMFQKVVKVSGKYDYVHHNDQVLKEKVNRVFASLDDNDGTLYKKHKSKETLDKTPSTPIHCFIDNGNVENKPIPAKLDKQWYINEAKSRIEKFI